MTWEKIRKTHTWLPQSSDGWSQHPNGGGWVQIGCQVSPDCHIDETSIVRDSATVSERSNIRDSNIRDSITRNSNIRDSTVNRAIVSDGSRISDSAINHSFISARAVLSGGEHVRSPIWIVGTQHSIGYSRPGYIASGCIIEPLEWWLGYVERCAKEHGYDKDAQREYRLHVEHIAAWMRLYGVDVADETDGRG